MWNNNLASWLKMWLLTMWKALTGSSKSGCLYQKGHVTFCQNEGSHLLCRWPDTLARG